MHQSNVKEAIQILKDAKDKVNDLLSPLTNLQTRSNHVLKSLIGGLEFTIGSHHQGATDAVFKPQPLTHVMGVKVERPEKIKIEAATPTNPDVEALRKKAEEAYSTFCERKNADLLEGLTDLELRAVAKMAGMDVSITEPAKIDSQFITKIKAAIQRKKEIDESTQKANQ
jgi:hypothetical protein